MSHLKPEMRAVIFQFSHLSILPDKDKSFSACLENTSPLSCCKVLVKVLFYCAHLHKVFFDLNLIETEERVEWPNFDCFQQKWSVVRKGSILRASIETQLQACVRANAHGRTEGGSTLCFTVSLVQRQTQCTNCTHAMHSCFHSSLAFTAVFAVIANSFHATRCSFQVIPEEDLSSLRSTPCWGC